MSQIKASIKIDATEVANQIEEIVKLFQLKYGPLESLPDDVVNLFLSNLYTLVDSVVLSNAPATISTTGSIEICLKVEIVGSADHLASAIRAGKMDSLASHRA